MLLSKRDILRHKVRVMIEAVIVSKLVTDVDFTVVAMKLQQQGQPQQQ